MASHKLKISGIRASLAFLCGFLLSQGAAAMGLGEIEVKTLLNEPLLAEVSILNVGNLDQSQILVALGTDEDYARVGVEREYSHSELKFEVVIAPGGKEGVIRITTRDKITEPYLDFLLDVRWPTGRILRDYTALLDLPAYQTPAAPVVVRETVPEVTAREDSAPVASQTTNSQSAPVAFARGDEQQIVVAENDTLWGIASRHKPSDQVTLHQTMIAIQKTNPAAFLHNNINLLQAGAVLVLPTEQQALAIARLDSINAVQEQTRQWQEDAGAEAAVKAQPVTSSDEIVAPTPQQDSYDGHLKLASGGTSDAEVGGGSAAVDDRVERLRGALASTSEELDAVKREKLELQQRVAMLEDQVATMEQIGALKAGVESDEMANLQAAAGATQQALAEQAVAGNNNEAAQLDQASAQSDDETSSSVDEDKKNATSSPVIISEPEEEDGFPEMWKLLAGGIAILAGGAFILWRRRTAYSEFEFEEISTTPVAPIAAKKERKKSKVPDPASVLDDAFELFEQGRTNSGIELLNGAVEIEPYRSDLRLGLLQLLASAGDNDAVERQYAALRAIGSNEDIGRADDILSRHDMQRKTEDTPAAQAALDDELPLNLDDDIVDYSDALGLDQNREVAAVASPAENAGRATAAQAAEHSLDLDLDLDELDLSSDSDSLDLDSLDFDADEPGDVVLDIAADKEPEQALDLPDISDLEIDSEHLDDIFDEQDEDQELDLGEAMDAVSTKLELAEAYIDMGDHDAAREILGEVIHDGDDAQKNTARQLLGSIS